VTIIRQLDGKKESINGRCRHIGEGGMGAVLAGELPSNELVMLDFSLPGAKEPLHMRAAVRFRHGFHHGFEFLTVSPSQLELIRRTEKSLPPAE
jgi:hypothetical protein